MSAARNHGRWQRKVDPGGEPETQALIEEALGTMNPKLRAALVLREIEGLSYEEISEILGISPDSVRSPMTRAREAFRKHLAGRIDLSAVQGWSAELAD